MNRRKAIGRIALAGAGAGLLAGGYKWWDWTKTPDVDFVTQHQALLDDLAETIIPKTDTPGAREAGVGAYIAIMIRDCTGRMSANKFADGLRDLVHYCQSHFDKPFQQCSDQEKISVLQYFERKGAPFRGIVGKAQEAYLGRSFFSTLKAYTVQGYCSSRPGATVGLAYSYVPGSYHGCIPLGAGQHSWATR